MTTISLKFCENLRYFTGESVGKAEIKNQGNESHAVICVPMDAVLAAVNVKHIDYMVIDTVGIEPQIVESINFNEIEIDFFDIECNECRDKPDGKNEIGVPTCNRQRLLKKLMSSRGYDEILFISPIDIIYKRRTLKLS